MLPKTFCILPFSQMTIVNDGKAQLCCRTDLNPMSEGRCLSLHWATCEQIWNSDYLRSVRSQMLAGEKIPDCSQCYSTEADGGTSLRQIMNTQAEQLWRVSGEEGILDKATAIVREGGKAPPPSALHLWLGNLCNLKCRMCSPMFSSQIAADPIQAQWFGDRIRAEILLPVYLDEVKYTGLGELTWRGEKLTRPVKRGKVTISLPANGAAIDLIEISGWKNCHQPCYLSVMAGKRAIARQLLSDGQWQIAIELAPTEEAISSLELSLHFLHLLQPQSLLSNYQGEQICSWGLQPCIDIDNLRIVSQKKSDKGQEREILSRIPENTQWSSNEKLVFEEILAHPESLNLLLFAGGEPLIHPMFPAILKKLIDTDHAGHISLYISTNGTVYNRRLSEMLKQFLSVELAFSVEGIGQLQEYIRYPSRWERIARNIFAFQKDHISLSVRPTAQAYNIFGILDLVRWCQENGLRFCLDSIVWSPKFLSLDMLPQVLIDEAFQDWQQFLASECDQDNRWHLETVIAALQRPRPDSEELMTLQGDFIEFTNDIDRSRGQSLALACPRLYNRLVANGFDFSDKYRFF
ncbi:MAG: radical SAM protein [Microcystis aeruginosa Ma_MB_F_20061100_S19]|uniref:Putative heme d1 biosynthesis radical SAM protein NirJ1 n=1 Tax=Microcystis aeruginosa SPC777 TaxID=482300 RepID=S3JH86_MICAE|nr:radical SAM protein [Microcystis aeruginosa]NCS00208.1 radical SAM protein [Microcystis aeruginosa L311-01]OCY12408.1 MAG: heme d1 biosynthesis radical SAM protein NirJ1 [Microcystis aeruginosa CACIAM 03]TRU17376.1 MAG: radical SAM protein [Microcystis aeruginosa Ma_MB_F_20061100_S19D]TRU17793.1 MAG: radical SAM protein [Microcystis aeruginosa Ma_MB_F_20061100_S19]EPF19572.1 putative heme d1 biosynthesis radical SAM protein NirJ1 [Microcystis aeruginosa SPC777]